MGFYDNFFFFGGGGEFPGGVDWPRAIDPQDTPEITLRANPAVVAWLAKASVFHSVNLALSANGGSNHARDVYTVPWLLLLLITRHNGPTIFIIDVCYGVMV